MTAARGNHYEERYINLADVRNYNGCVSGRLGGFTVLRPSGERPDPRAIQIGSGFRGNIQLPEETVLAAFDVARGRMLANNKRGAWLRGAGEIAGWLSFAATAAITLVAGFYGRAPALNGGGTDTSGLPARSVRIIGFLAAFAGVLTAFASLAGAQSQEYFKRADDVRNAMLTARAQVIDEETTAQEEQAAIDDMLVIIR